MTHDQNAPVSLLLGRALIVTLVAVIQLKSSPQNCIWPDKHGNEIIECSAIVYSYVGHKSRPIIQHIYIHTYIHIHTYIYYIEIWIKPHNGRKACDGHLLCVFIIFGVCHMDRLARWLCATVFVIWMHLCEAYRTVHTTNVVYSTSGGNSNYHK